VERVIAYAYDDLDRLTGADYSTDEAYAYQYDPVGNCLLFFGGDPSNYTNKASELIRTDSFALQEPGPKTNTFQISER
jgi:hypothetical protein